MDGERRPLDARRRRLEAQKCNVFLVSAGHNKKIPSLEETAFFWKGTICAVSTVQVYICWYSYYNYTKTNTVYIHYVHIYVCNIYIHIYMYSMIIYACVLLLLNGIFVKRGRNQSFIIH